MINAPSPFAEIIDNVNVLDRLFFEANSDAREYTRAYVLGEFWPILLRNCQLVKVTRLSSEARIREPILFEGKLN